MRERIQRLRNATLEAVPRISMERARLLTECIESPECAREPVPVQRAMAFRHILANKELYVGPDEMFVGARGVSTTRSWSDRRPTNFAWTRRPAPI